MKWASMISLIKANYSQSIQLFHAQWQLFYFGSQVTTTQGTSVIWKSKNKMQWRKLHSTNSLKMMVSQYKTMVTSNTTRLRRTIGSRKESGLGGKDRRQIL